MGELNCELSSLVYSELYRLLVTTQDFEDLLSARLAEIGYGLEWLEEASEAYQAKWESDLQYLDEETVSTAALEQPGHALLATWILAGLRNAGPCYELSSSLISNVLQTATTDIGSLRAPLPPSLSPTVVGWTLGKLIGSADLPAMPAQLPENDNVRAAYLGFVEHISLLQGMREPWPEMMCMAIYWRGYGLAEGLLPDLGGGGQALRQLLNEARLSMERNQYATLHQHFQHFNRRRQAVSHVADDPSRPAFVDVIPTLQDSVDLRLPVQGITQFVHQEVSKRLAEPPVPAPLQRDPWSYLLPQIQTW